MGGLFCGGWFLSRLISLLMNGNDSAAKEHRKGKINDGKMQSKLLVELGGISNFEFGFLILDQMFWCI